MEDYVIVARRQVPRSEARCIKCGEPFKNGVNVFTKAGFAEVAISGLCETCFDAIFQNEEGEE